MGAGASSSAARSSQVVVPADDSHGIGAYLAKVKSDNQWISDSLSGERLDINAQCVNVRVRTKGGADASTADQSIAYACAEAAVGPRVGGERTSSRAARRGGVIS